METKRCDRMTQTRPRYFPVSRAWKKSTPQAVWSKTKQRVVRADVTKNRFESPWRPTVPGPVASASMLTSEKEPLMMPKPRPETE